MLRGLHQGRCRTIRNVRHERRRGQSGRKDSNSEGSSCYMAETLCKLRRNVALNSRMEARGLPGLYGPT